MTNKDIREYNTKELPYHFVLFHHLTMNQLMMLTNSLGEQMTGNAVLTYCYIDKMAGMSYKVICGADLRSDGSVEFHVPDKVTAALTLREGSIECPAIVIDEDDELVERFRDDAELIKENYGYLEDRIEEHEDVMFDEFRHPAYPQDILVTFLARDYKIEKIWVREVASCPEGVVAMMIDEPYHPMMGVHNGERVIVVPHKLDDGSVIPFAALPWMQDQ